MLTINVPTQEFWNESKEEFVTIKGQEIRLEHSLVSLSKWEAKWHKPFLGREDKTTEETLDYIKCMTISQNVNPEVYSALTKENYKEINDYISDSMSATTINNRQEGYTPNREIMTAEVIYYYMIALNIPVEFQKWHLNRLMKLIQVCSIKQAPPKKMSQSAIMSRNAELNAARRKAMNTKG